MTAVQALATFAVLALPTLATRAAPAYGFGPEAVGYQISVAYLAGAVMSGMAGLVVRRAGAAAASLLALVLAASGLVGLASGILALAVIGSMLIGVAYGLTNPAASHLLFRFSPPKRQNLIFALKQTGVPAGGMLAALMLPALDRVFGWQAAMLLGALLYLVLMVPLLFARSRLDDDRNPKARIAGGVMAGVRVVVHSRKLLGFGIMGFSFASAQFCLFAFLITMLVSEFGWTLVEAGGLATLMQVGGAAGRIVWSMVADRVGRGLDVLIGIGVLSLLCSLLLGLAHQGWPSWLLAALLITFGFCIIGWNGLWLAEVARSCRPEEVSLATGGILCFTFLGIVVGPAAFATAYKVTGSYATTYALTALIIVCGICALLWSRIDVKSAH